MTGWLLYFILGGIAGFVADEFDIPFVPGIIIFSCGFLVGLVGVYMRGGI